MSSVQTTQEPQSISRPSRRSRAGCWTCRSKTVKKRCDQQQPTCGRCARLGIPCDYSKRPTLAERRRARKEESTKQTRVTTEELPSSISKACIKYDNVSTRAIVSLSPPKSSACSLDLTYSDLEAIRHFRTNVAKSHHVKDTEYSLISLMFKIAKVEPMVMHMVISTGLQEINSRRYLPDLLDQGTSVQHYSSALRFMAKAVSSWKTANDLDIIFTALWMMLIYEQQYGDTQCSAYKHHLEGISSLLSRTLDKVQIRQLSESESAGGAVQGALLKNKSYISVYSARVLVWIALLDAAAAFSGIGGQVNSALLRTLLLPETSSATKFTDPMQAFAGFRQYSDPLYYIAWGEKYPQHELLDDMENRDAYALLAACVQLRYMTAQVADHYHNGSAIDQIGKTMEVEAYIDRIGSMYEGLIEAASSLSLETDNTFRLTSNLRAIVPTYHAVILDFMRLTTFNENLTARQYKSLNQIMNLAYQSHKHGGKEAIIKIAWPLFIAAMETDDHLHQIWVLERFSEMSQYGQNFKRANDFLREFLPIQMQLGRRINLREQMKNRPVFVLS